MLCVAGTLMAFAWIGHLKFKDWNFLTALGMSWLLVLPEYLLNVFSARWGREVFTGAQMASIHLAAGVVCVALVSKFYLGEPLNWYQIAGFIMMGASVLLIVFKGG